MSAVRVDRAAFARAVLAKLAMVVAAVVANGWPALSEWWDQLYARLLHSGARQLVARVGRRGGKSSSACIFAVAFALVYAGLGLVPPGDVGWVVFVSVSIVEAQSRLRTIRRILDVLGVSYLDDGDTLIIDGTNIGFRVQACTVASVSGWTSILIVADEVAKWRDRDTGTNPATEVLAALRPTMATQRLAMLLMLSSPLGTGDAHAVAFAAGDTDFQMVAWAPTWVANPTLSESDCAADEPDERRRAREYDAVPSDSDLSVIAGETFDTCVVQSFDGFQWLGDRNTGLFDGAMGGGDAEAHGCCRYAVPYADEQLDVLWMSATRNRGLVREDLVRAGDVVTIVRATPARNERGENIPNPRAGWRPRPRLCVWGLGALEGKFAAHTDFDGMLDGASRTFRANRVKDVIGDSYMGFALVPGFRKRGHRYHAQVWDHGSKSRAVLRLRQMFRDKAIAILDEGPETLALRAEIVAFREKLLPSGVSSFGARSGAHDDRIALLINAAMADSDTEENLLRGSPIGRDRARHEVPEASPEEVRAFYARQH